jgi:hypothetical protein
MRGDPRNIQLIPDVLIALAAWTPVLVAVLMVLAERKQLLQE